MTNRREKLGAALSKYEEMKLARFTEEEIIALLQEHEAGATTADLARRHGSAT